MFGILVVLGCGFGLVVAQTVPSPKQRHSYDYVVVGGGTSGLVVANRLSENPDITVAVVEAGDSVYNDYEVKQVENWFANLGTDIDWQYKTQPQSSTFDRILTYNQGKALAGTSAINGGTYIRAQKAQIDAWETLGNTGWDWASLFPYYKKSEHFQKPGPCLIAKGVTYDPAVHGYRGPLDVGWTNNLMGGNAHEVLTETWQNIGVPYNIDQSGGELRGFSIWPNTVNTKLQIREDAARAYYWPVAHRPNLDVYVNTTAEKLVWAEEAGYTSTTKAASGVQVHPVGGEKSRVLNAKKGVIVSLGSLKSPVFLEQSGVGNPAILNKHQVPIKVKLNSVGESLQDQTNIILIATANTTYSGYTPFVAYTTASDLFGSNTSSVASSIRSSIPAYASLLAAQSSNAYTAAQVKKQLNVQADLIFNQATPIGETVVFITNTSLYTVFWPLLPFSRGSVHLSSATNASATPLINPNFFLEGITWDAVAATALANLNRKYAHTDPLGTMIGEDIVPNRTAVPLDAGVDTWLPFFKQAYNTNYHPVGTCAMMSRELGGVVSPELLVYGTRNVRVVDASVLPFQVDGHLTSTLYAIAERASDIIKRCHGTRPKARHAE